MYDEDVRSVSLNSDEIEIIKELLSYHLDHCVSVGEEISVRELLDKLG